MVKRKSGQTIIFLLMVLLALTFMTLWIIDQHRFIALKLDTQDAGDAAALTAARWQGTTLNLVGELNLLHALALTQEDFSAVDTITNIQLRLCLTGPLQAFAAAQVTAKNNRIHVSQDATNLLREHANRVRNIYATQPEDSDFLHPPYPGAWQEYAEMIDLVADEGIAAAPENARFFTDPEDGHPLLNQAFYNAIAGENWCWFHLYAPGLLQSYSGWASWPPLPDPEEQAAYNNSEIFGLSLAPQSGTLRALLQTVPINSSLSGLGHNAINLPLPEEREYVLDLFETWFYYTPEKWDRWAAFHYGDADALPATADVRQEYDYTGADAAVRIEAPLTRFSSTDNRRQTDTSIWTAAAKPFGYLGDGARRSPPNAYGIVLPAFRDVRLIPLDASTAPASSHFSLGWQQHISVHLPLYVDTGETTPGCSYCTQLQIWENEAWRQLGIAWLDLYSGNCRIPQGGGRHGGGSRRGH